MKIIPRNDKQKQEVKGNQEDTRFGSLFHTPDGETEFNFVLRCKEDSTREFKYADLGKSSCFHLVKIADRDGKPVTALVLADDKDIMKAENKVAFCVFKDEVTEFKDGSGYVLNGENELGFVKAFMKEGKNSYAGNMLYRGKINPEFQKSPENRMKGAPPKSKEEPKDEEPDTEISNLDHGVDEEGNIHF